MYLTVNTPDSRLALKALVEVLFTILVYKEVTIGIFNPVFLLRLFRTVFTLTPITQW